MEHKPGINTYVNYLEKNAVDPIDYVMGLFEQNNIVVLGERLHHEMSQWEFIYKLTSDPRFIKNVGNIFTEYGSVSQQPELEAFLASESFDEKALIHIMRGFPVWPDGWPNKNFHDFLARLRELNKGLDTDSKIHLLFSDIPRDWEKITREEFEASYPVIMVRDEFMASRILLKFIEILKSPEKRKKALVVMNYRHAFSKELLAGQHNTAAYLMENLQHKRVTNVMLNTVSITPSPDGSAKLLQSGKWDAAFAVLGNKPMGFSFQDSPFGRDHFDYWDYTPHKFGYKDIFEGMIFYSPVSEMTLANTYPGYYDKEFKDIFNKRAALYTGAKFRVLPKELAEIIESRKDLDNKIANTDWEPKHLQYDPAPMRQWLIEEPPTEK